MYMCVNFYICICGRLRSNFSGVLQDIPVIFLIQGFSLGHGAPCLEGLLVNELQG